jgi:hypothetical protein
MVKQRKGLCLFIFLLYQTDTVVEKTVSQFGKKLLLPFNIMKKVRTHEGGLQDISLYYVQRLKME